MNFNPLLMRLAIYGPVLLVWSVGIVMALFNWRRHPRVALLASVAFGLQILQSGWSIMLYYWASTQTARAGFAVQDLGWIFNVSAFIQTGLSAISWALIVVALFRWRYEPRRILGHDGQYLPEDFAIESERRS